ncbi:hypothetical protein [Acholeplasma laidlawii]|uniref:hypothetical protein n=1 Tax=Acholeplasma laidlawii TaxID=2148 RepID=UPI00084CD208|nr:hypothetical protein [Acholeplasma laidlawii]OED28672.1 hypothetical protein A9268_04625 [Acholeplasma laidlawii]
MKKIMLLLVVALSATILTANNAHAYDGVNRDSNGNITEVDLNGDVFVDGDYSAATWEINLEDMATDPYYKNAAIALPLQFVPMLEIKNKIFHFYKSLFVKYDAKLTSELILLLLAYETAMDELMIEQQNNAQSYYEKAIGYSIELILTKKLDKLAPVVQIFLDENMLMASVEVTMDNVIDAIADSIYDTENIEDPYTKFIVELVKGIGVETVQDFSHKSLGELVSSTGKNLGNLIIDTLVSQILSLPETLITQHPLGKLAFAAIYWMMGQEAQYAAEQYALILDNITAFLTALLNPYNMGKNIRFDYLIEHNINTNTISWSENYVEQEGFIANKHRGMAITFADTDVIYRNISSSYGVTNFTRDPDKYVQVKGRINLLNESQMYSEINNLFDKQYRAHNSNPNKFIFSSGYTERYYENRYTGIRYYA